MIIFLRRRKNTVLVFIMIFSLTGCWSSKQIEDRTFNVGVAIDSGKEHSEEKDFQREGATYDKKDELTVTYQYVKTSTTKPEAQGAGQKKYSNVSESGDSNHQMIRDISLRQEKPITFHHTKVIVINLELLKRQSLKELLDYYLWDNELRPSCLVFVSNGPARGVLESNKSEIIPAFRLIGMIGNSYRNTKILEPVSLAKLRGNFDSGQSYLLQNIYSLDGDIKFSGAAIINGRNNLLLETINEDEFQGINLLKRKITGGLIKTTEATSGKVIIYEIEALNTKIIPKVKKNNISFDVKIQSKGRISESWTSLTKSSKKKYINDIEKLIELETEKIIKNAIKKTQKDLHVDVAGFGKQLRIKYPKVWLKVKNNWDEIFTEVPINYTINMEITDFGYRELN
ncbi:Ger(x)C family spore germination protein [Cytobacillus praedii]|uniref:Ger(x)C family spore germination protein n=1 Tax=Cytobacillus praedii TaxID=1742358 RepID=UPI002E1E24C5|nr:Ger(x)C family spore germination protein [Cytobacillus praedii]